MKAFICSLTTSQPLIAPITPPTIRASRSETGSTSHSGDSVKPRPMPREQNRMPVTMAVRPATDSTDRSMLPAMMTMARPIAMTPTNVDCSMMLAKMPIWKKFGIVSEKTASTNTSMNQTRLSRTNSITALCRGELIMGDPDWNPGPLRARDDLRVDYSTGLTGSVGAFEIAPEARLIDIVLGDRGARDLQVRSPGSRSSASNQAQAHYRCRA